VNAETRNRHGIAVDRAGDAYVAGITSSLDFPTTEGAFDHTCGGCPDYGDAFVTKFARRSIGHRRACGVRLSRARSRFLALPLVATAEDD
jgi:hypothetical protein